MGIINYAGDMMFHLGVTKSSTKHEPAALSSNTRALKSTHLELAQLAHLS